MSTFEKPQTEITGWPCGYRFASGGLCGTPTGHPIHLGTVNGPEARETHEWRPLPNRRKGERRAEARQQGGIDVERLARAMMDLDGDWIDQIGWMHGEYTDRSRREVAEEIARLYRAALASEPVAAP